MPDAPSEPLITSPAALAELADHLRARGRFAFDTEFVSEETFEPVLGLIQVATDERVAAVDPIAVRDLDLFWDVLTGPGVEVVMHASGEDLRICRIETGKLPERVIDVQIAAGLAGYSFPLSLGALVSQTIGASVHSGETRTDWRRRPLSASQIRYALDDVRYLLPVADHLARRLTDLRRTEWAEYEFRDKLAETIRREDDDRWRRLAGLHQLNRRGLEVARRLFDWRKEAARQADRPVRQVLRDDLLIAIAKRQPSGHKDLEALREFNRPHLLARSREILDLIAEAQAVPPDQLPEPPERPDDGPGLAMVSSLLAATLNHCCARNELSVGLVGTTSDLKDLVRWHLAGRPADRPPALAEGWRGSVCGQTLLDVLAGRLALRISDPRADVPVALEPVGEGPSS